MSEEELARYSGLYWDAKTESFRGIDVVDGKLTSDYGGELIPLGDHVFQIVNRPMTLTFSLPEAGEPLRMQETYADFELTNFVAVPEAETTTASELAEYAGRYYSEELDHYWTFIVEDGQLVLSRGVHIPLRVMSREDVEELFELDAMVFERAFSDTFTGGWFLVRFTRDQGERVTSFAASTSPMGWVRRVRFVKQLP